MEIDGLDHLVLTVRDIDTTCAWYARALGVKTIDFGAGRKALACGLQKINLHPVGAGFPPMAASPTPGSADLCLLTATPVEEIARHLAAQSIPLVEGPVTRTGAAGPLLSIYLRDPDGNLIEVANVLHEPAILNPTPYSPERHHAA